MFYRCFLPGLCVLVSCSPFYGSTIVTANSTCQAFLNSSQDPIFTQSKSVTFETNTPRANFTAFVSITGLDCVTPYGFAAFNDFPGETGFRSGVDPGAGAVFDIAQGLSIESADPTKYQLGISLDIHVSTSETFIPKGGSGTGFLTGNVNTVYEFDESEFLLVSQSSFATTPFGSYDPTGCPTSLSCFSYQFVFDQPFTIDMEGDVAVAAKSRMDFGTLGAGVFIRAGTTTVTDANGNPISGAIFTPVPAPEPGGAFLSGTGFLLGTIFLARSFRRSKWMFRR